MRLLHVTKIYSYYLFCPTRFLLIDKFNLSLHFSNIKNIDLQRKICVNYESEENVVV